MQRLPSGYKPWRGRHSGADRLINFRPGFSAGGSLGGASVIAFVILFLVLSWRPNEGDRGCGAAASLRAFCKAMARLLAAPLWGRGRDAGRAGRKRSAPGPEGPPRAAPVAPGGD